MNKICSNNIIEYLVLNGDLIILESSPGAEQFADLPQEVIPGKDVRSGFPELIGLEQILQQLLESKQEHFVLRGINRTSVYGDVIYFDLCIRGFEKKLIVLLDDVTETMLLKQSLVQRANEAEFLLSALTISQNYINNLLFFMADALLVTTESGKIKTVNKAAEELFNLTEVDLINNFISQFLGKNYWQEIQQARKINEGNNFFYSQETEYIPESGKSISLEFSCSTVPTEIKDVVDFLHIGRNITARKKAEEEIRKALIKEKELGDLKSRFISMTSHEFKNPLSSILLCVEYLEKNLKINSHEGSYLNYIKSSAEEMNCLLNDVLVVAKADRGKLEFQPKLVDLEKFCQDLIAELQLIFPGNRIQFICESTCDLVSIDPKLWRYIFLNLLSNALKYSRETILCCLYLCGGKKEIKLKITDRGIGITLKDKKHLFEAFHRGENVKDIPGTGLGLSIVKRALDLHGGKIFIKSKVNIGTEITVKIPLAVDR